METISTGSVVISESLNGHLLAHLHQGNTSKCEELTCLSSLRERSSARILSGKYLSEPQGQRNMPARLRDLVSALQPARTNAITRSCAGSTSNYPAGFGMSIAKLLGEQVMRINQPEKEKRRFVAVTSLSKSRWYWVIWPSLDEIQASDEPLLHVGEGYEKTKSEAVERALELAGNYAEVDRSEIRQDLSSQQNECETKKARSSYPPALQYPQNG